MPHAGTCKGECVICKQGQVRGLVGVIIHSPESAYVEFGCRYVVGGTLPLLIPSHRGEERRPTSSLTQGRQGVAKPFDGLKRWGKKWKHPVMRKKRPRGTAQIQLLPG